MTDKTNKKQFYIFVGISVFYSEYEHESGEATFMSHSKRGTVHWLPTRPHPQITTLYNNKTMITIWAALNSSERFPEQFTWRSRCGEQQLLMLRFVTARLNQV